MGADIETQPIHWYVAVQVRNYHVVLLIIRRSAMNFTTILTETSGVSRVGLVWTELNHRPFKEKIF
jgi:hypothetical protein